MNNTYSKALKDTLILLFLLLLACWPIVSGISSLKWDIINLTFPWNYFISECLHQGELPLWNPYINGGFTQGANVDTWYPLHWVLAWVWGFDIYAMQFSYLLHLYIGGIGFYILGHQHHFNRFAKVGTAASYMLSGFALSHAQHLGWITGLAWLPWLWWAVRHFFKTPCITNALILSVIGHFYITGAYPGLSIIGFYLISGLCIQQIYQYRHRKFLLKKTIILLVLSLILVLFLCSPCLLSMIDVAPTVNRGKALGINDEAKNIFTGDLSWPGLLSFLFPFATSVDNEFWLSPELSILNCYIGILPLIITIIILFSKPKVKSAPFIYLCLGIIFLMTAIPSVFPFRKWLYHSLPLMGYFRFPTLFRLGAIFFFLLASGLFFSRRYKFDNLVIRPYFGGLFLFGVGMIIILIYQANHTDQQLFSISKIKNWQDYLSTASVWERISLQSAIHLLLILTFFLSLFFLDKKKHSRYLLLFWLLDLFLATQLNLYVSVVGFHSPALISKECSALPDYFPNPRLDVSLATLSNIPGKANRHLTTNLNIFHKTPTAHGDSPFSFNYMNKAIDNGRYEELIHQPLFFLVSTINKDSSISKKNIIPFSTTSLQIESFSPVESILNVNTSQNCYLVFTQNYFHRWSAYVNSQAKKIQRVNDTFMAIKLSPGSHKVRFVFEFDLLRIAVYFSALLSIIIWFILFHNLTNTLLGKSHKLYAFIFLSFLSALFIIGIYNNLDRKNKKDTIKELALINESLPDTLQSDDRTIFINKESSPQSEKTFPELPLWYSQDQQTIFEELGQVKTEQVLIIENYPLPSHKAHWLPYANISYGPLIWQDSSQERRLFLFQRKKEFPIYSSEIRQTWPIVIRDSIQFLSKKQSAHVRSSQEYLNLYKEKITFVNKHKAPKAAFLVFDILSETATPCLLVFEIHRKGKRLSWYSQQLYLREQFIHTWQKMGIHQKIPLKLEEGDELRAYLWNNKENEFWLDNTRLHLYEKSF